jgi:hypothetical protein
VSKKHARPPGASAAPTVDQNAANRAGGMWESQKAKKAVS